MPDLTGSKVPGIAYASKNDQHHHCSQLHQRIGPDLAEGIRLPTRFLLLTESAQKRKAMGRDTTRIVNEAEAAGDRRVVMKP